MPEPANLPGQAHPGEHLDKVRRAWPPAIAHIPAEISISHLLSSSVRRLNVNTESTARTATLKYAVNRNSDARSDSLRWLQDAIEVDVPGSAAQQVTLGGSNSSLEKNNVFGTEPKVYSGVARASCSHCAAAHLLVIHQSCWQYPGMRMPEHARRSHLMRVESNQCNVRVGCAHDYIK